MFQSPTTLLFKARRLKQTLSSFYAFSTNIGMEKPIPYSNDDEKNLYQCKMNIQTLNNKNINLNMDTAFNQNKPTVIMMHGAPGSYKDFKYITPVLVEAGVRCIGINFPGVRPYWVTQLAGYLWSFRFLQPILAPLYFSDGQSAGICVQLVSNFDFGKQKDYINILNNCPWIRVLLAYSGKDFLLEEEISQEVVKTHKDICSKTEDDAGIIEEAKQQINAGHKSVAVFFPNEGHFLQKHRAKFVAQSILAIIDKKRRDNKL